MVAEARPGLVRPLTVAVCAVDGCDNTFTPRDHRNRYCTPTCASRDRSRRRRADPEVHASDRAKRRQRWAENPEWRESMKARSRNLYHTDEAFRERTKERAHWNLTSVQYAQKLMVNRRRAALQRLSERKARSEERSEGGPTSG